MLRPRTFAQEYADLCIDNLLLAVALLLNDLDHGVERSHLTQFLALIFQLHLGELFKVTFASDFIRLFSLQLFDQVSLIHSHAQIISQCKGHVSFLILLNKGLASFGRGW